MADVNSQVGTDAEFPSQERIKLNIGGELFETTVSTLQAGGPESLLFALSNRRRDDGFPVFIDRDPEIFSVLLSLLRTNRFPSNARRFSKQELADEAFYYGMEDLFKSAISPPPLLGIDASVVATILPASEGLISAFTAAAGDDSVWIAHGGQISRYDWNLSHGRTIRSHLEEVTSIRRVWTEIAAVGSVSASGLHFYDFSRGRLVGSTHWTDPRDPRIYKARVTAITDSANFVFAAFDCPHRENCILVIDKSTLQMTSVLGRQPGSSSKNLVAGKLTCLPETNLIVGSAISSGAFGYSGYIRLWDPRSGDVVWETNEPGSGRSSRFGDSFADVEVDVEQSMLFKVCSKSGDLGMADLRKLGEDPWVYLKDKNPSLQYIGGAGKTSYIIHCYRKQVFVGIEGDLEVWSRLVGTENGGEEKREIDEYLYKRNYVDKVEESKRGIINKIEGGKDRLFVSREDVEGIEVWESSYSSGTVSIW